MDKQWIITKTHIHFILSTFFIFDKHMGMDQYLLIPCLGEWTSIYQLFWCSPGVQGFDTMPYYFYGYHINIISDNILYYPFIISDTHILSIFIIQKNTSFFFAPLHLRQMRRAGSWWTSCRKIPTTWGAPGDVLEGESHGEKRDEMMVKW